MPSSFTPLLKLELPATGELSGTWGTTVNNAITTPLSEAIAGTTTITVGGSDYTLSNGDGSAANEARKMFIVATGTPGASRNVICPAASKFYVFRNDTNQTLTLKTLSGTGIAVPAGQYRFLYCNGTDVVETFNAMASLTLGTALGTASGGTGLNSFTANRVFYASSTSAIAQSANLTFNGTTLVANDFTDSSLTATRVTYAGAGGNLTDSANLTFDGTSLTLGGNPTLSAGTANGVLYLNGSKVATSGTALAFNGTTLSVTGNVSSSNAGNENYFLSDGSTRSSLQQSSNALYYNVNDNSATSGSFIWRNTNAFSELMRLTSTGLGIGGTPTQKLDVFGDIQQQNANYLRGRLAAGTVTRLFGLNSANSLYIGGIDASQSEMLFVRGGATQMVLDSSGSLLIGSSISSSTVGFGAGLLQVSSNSFAAGQIYTHNGTTGNTSAIELSRSRGTKAAPTIVTDGSDLGAIFFNGYDGVNYRPAAHIYCYVDGTPGASVMPGALVFSTTRPGNAGPTESMRLDSSGNLGLGVTPSAWSGLAAALQVQRASIVTSSTGAVDTYFSSNGFWSSGWKYMINGAATQYIQNASGDHRWLTAPSGTAGNAISFNQALTLQTNSPFITGTNLDAGSNSLAIGMTSAGLLAFFTNNQERARITSGGDLLVGGTSTSTIPALNKGIYLQSATNNDVIGYSVRIDDGVNGRRGSMFLDDANGVFGWDVTASSGVPEYVWRTAGQERARITSVGAFLVGTTSTNGAFSLNTNTETWAAWLQQAHTTTGRSLVRLQYNVATPNVATDYFLYCDDATAVRANIRSNGGLANYQSNNVDLSDARTKKDITPAPSYWSKIGALEIVTYKYKDQTHDDINVGVIAQQVEQVEPVWVDTEGFGEVPEGEEPMKTVYTKDITFAAIKALQEAMFRIEALEAKVAALETH